MSSWTTFNEARAGRYETVSRWDSRQRLRRHDLTRPIRHRQDYAGEVVTPLHQPICAGKATGSSSANLDTSPHTIRRPARRAIGRCTKYIAIIENNELATTT